MTRGATKRLLLHVLIPAELLAAILGTVMIFQAASAYHYLLAFSLLWAGGCVAVLLMYTQQYLAPPQSIIGALFWGGWLGVSGILIAVGLLAPMALTDENLVGTVFWLAVLGVTNSSVLVSTRRSASRDDMGVERDSKP